MARKTVESMPVNETNEPDDLFVEEAPEPKKKRGRPSNAEKMKASQESKPSKPELNDEARVLKETEEVKVEERKLQEQWDNDAEEQEQKRHDKAVAEGKELSYGDQSYNVHMGLDPDVSPMELGKEEGDSEASEDVDTGFKKPERKASKKKEGGGWLRRLGGWFTGEVGQ